MQQQNLSLNFTIEDSWTISSCWYNIINSSGDMINTSGGDDIYTINTTILNCQNTTFNVSRDDTYNLTMWVNNSENNVGLDSVEFGVSATPPATTLDAPEETIINYSTNIYFNFTATDSDGLNTCELWGNWSGGWHKNYTWISPESAIMNYTIVNITDGLYNWNVWCNDSLDNGDFGLNQTIEIDTIYPTIIIGIVGTTPGSNVIYFFPDIDDKNLDKCWFSVYDSDGNIEYRNENITFNCKKIAQTLVSTYATYDLYVYANDSVGHESSSILSFTTSPVSAPAAGGGGGIVTPEPIKEKSFCGDLICQEKNDFGFRENYWSCPSDCPGYDLDELFFGISVYCFDRDPNTPCLWTEGLFSFFLPLPGNETTCGDNLCEGKENMINCKVDCGTFSMDTLYSNCVDEEIANSPCFWQQNLAFVVIFEFFVVLFILSMVKIKTIDRRKVSTFQYIKLKFKKKRRR